MVESVVRSAWPHRGVLCERIYSCLGDGRLHILGAASPVAGAGFLVTCGVGNEPAG